MEPGGLGQQKDHPDERRADAERQDNHKAQTVICPNAHNTRATGAVG